MFLFLPTINLFSTINTTYILCVIKAKPVLQLFLKQISIVQNVSTGKKSSYLVFKINCNCRFKYIYIRNVPVYNKITEAHKRTH